MSIISVVGRGAMIATSFLALLIGAQPAAAAEATGKIVMTQGHIVPSCRTVLLRRSSDQTIMTFRIAGTGLEDAILAVSLTALASNLTVTINYEPGVGSGCGTEPRITVISIHSSV